MQTFYIMSKMIKSSLFFFLINTLIYPYSIKGLANDLTNQDQQIFKKVWLAKGISGNPKKMPKIVLKTTNTGTQVNQDVGKILIDPGLLEVCESFGNQRDKALAFVFGQIIYSYIDGSSFSIMPDSLARPSDKSRFLKCDKKGIIYAYMAGYPMLGIYAQLLREIYNHYGKPNAVFLQYRLRQGKTLSEKLKQFFLTFQTANYLLMANEGLAAHECYEYILKEYNSKEIYNNAGANLLKMIMEDDHKRKFLYPIILDFSSNLAFHKYKHSQRRVTQPLINKMLHFFRMAVQIDTTYLPSYLNLISFFTMKHQFIRANEYLVKVEQLANSNKSTLLREIKVLKGLIAYKSINQAIGEAILDTIASKVINVKKDIAYYNLLVMKGARNTTLKVILSDQENAHKLAPHEKIAGIGLNIPNNREQDYKDGSANSQVKLTLSLGIGIYVDTLLNESRHNSALRIVFAYRSKIFYFLQTLPNYTGKTTIGGFSLGSDIKKIQMKDNYGLPSASIFSGEGYEFKIYNQRKIIFKVDKKGRLASWMLYH